MTRTVEKKIYEAYMHGRGVRLTFDDVAGLIQDDAVSVRINNQARREAGVEEDFTDLNLGFSAPKTWAGLIQNIKEIG